MGHNQNFGEDRSPDICSNADDKLNAEEYSLTNSQNHYKGGHQRQLL